MPTYSMFAEAIAPGSWTKTAGSAWAGATAPAPQATAPSAAAATIDPQRIDPQRIDFDTLHAPRPAEARTVLARRPTCDGRRCALRRIGAGFLPSRRAADPVLAYIEPRMWDRM
ncbi:hypothetical protein NHL50_15075 [Acidimicrobiia bacterium EGI L10123]|uniref:hypothetical protein n=1 Tax=Salinilacustrithrix flava TaxID=2957203 RepID=UPI003D7C1F13|nr:hypothetical protein [Acidimicrobiia bacterium EGI L10123]